MDNVIEQDQQAIWNELSAERTGKPAKLAAKPAIVPAEVLPVAEVKVDPFEAINARLNEFEKLGNRVRNVEGHIGNLSGAQKQMKEMIEAGKSAASQSGNAPTQTEIKAAAANPAEWDDLKKDYPEWADATEKFFDSRMQKNSGFDAQAFEQRITEQVEGKTKAIEEKIIKAALDGVLPGWQTEINSPEFIQWQSTQTEEIKALANSESVGDAARMFKLYEKSKDASPGNQITNQRKQILDAATATPKGVRTTNTQKSWEEMSSSEQWNYEKRLREKRNR